MPAASAVHNLVLAAGVFLATVAVARAGDWPQILGPNRNGIAVEERIANSLPSDGPRKIWDAKVGSGYAGIAVSGKVSVLFHRLGDEDTITAYNAATGEELWSRGFKTRFQPDIGGEDGPLCVPSIHNGRVYAFSPNGELHCVDLESGKPVWQRKTHQDFRAQAGYFGAGSSPLVEGKTLIVNVGGKDAASVVAFDLATGETVWKAVNDAASYSSPIAVTLEGKRHLLCITRLNFVSLDPATGQERFRTRFGQTGPTVNAAIPVLLKNQALLTASYGIGSELLTIHPDRVDIDWTEHDILASQYTTPIVHDGIIYGIDGRQDLGAVTLKCFDPQNRKVLWSKSGIGYATLIAADGKLLVMQTDGQLRIVKLEPSAYQEIGSTKLLSGTTRALPALANGLFYVRNESMLTCVNLAR